MSTNVSRDLVTEYSAPLYRVSCSHRGWWTQISQDCCRCLSCGQEFDPLYNTHTTVTNTASACTKVYISDGGTAPLEETPERKPPVWSPPPGAPRRRHLHR